MSKESLDEEAQRIQEMLKGKTVSKVSRHRSCEICIEFEDKTRLFIDIASEENLEFSITGS